MSDPIGPATPGQIHRIVERHRRELLALERGAAREMIAAYGAIWDRLRASIERLVRLSREAAEIGFPVSPSWVFEQERLETLQHQVEAEMARFARDAEALITQAERDAVTAAAQHPQEVIRAAYGMQVEWNRLPADAVSDLVGFTRNGSPLRALLDQLGPEASRVVRDGLIQGLALGQNPRQVARTIRGEFGGSLSRALTIARTETLRSYREATIRGYQANSEIVAGWRWVAAKQDRTCAACLAMDGTIHPNSERLDDHPNGRCVAAPVLRGMEGLTQWETGSQWLARQPEDVQRQVLGNAGYEAYRAGAVTLRDFVGQKHSEAWGSTRYVRSLSSVLGAEEARKWAKPPED